MPDAITSGRAVMDAIADGWELWHIGDSPLPGRWELRRGREHRPVHWDAIEIIRQRFLDWFEENTEAVQIGRFTWAYCPRQKNLTLTGAR